ncbi:hypothetical protein [Stenotrophobium rhamnosiphilum]|uniref:Uncharacterized protein n=1 Tax=Stenotrophobium rhamnosiphilum TaxID=2029166 RepID=A0A2T5ME11_9GAMM|nr:hypothetical protein [Stenotrophobium rhamnosiphilum]PTU30814.1 hypothetical protein CJD38_10900 [Stenotrophobium rhamnosiphilum]
MSTQVRHFLLTQDGGIREFSTDQAALIAAGASPLPEFAESRLRYLQLTLDDTSSKGELKVQSAGACVRFDAEGRVTETTAPGENEQITRFEHDAVVQWALRDIPTVAPIFH